MASNQPIGVNEVTDVDFYQLSFLTRLGVAWEPSVFLKVGATLTAPNLKITGSGSSSAQVTANNIPIVTNGGVLDFQSRFGSDFQEGLSTNYRTPLSAAVGTEVQPWAPLTVGLTVDYSIALGREALLHVQGGRPFFRGPGTEGLRDSTFFLTPLDERHAVVNVSFGAEYTLNDTYAAYVGFWTDFSPLKHQQLSETLRSEQGINLATADIDLYHVVVGATRTTTRSKIAAGVVVSYGTGTAPSDVDITVTGDVLGVTQGERVFERHVSFFSLSLLLGYTYFF